jgi:BirA family biotin operon repressor/biotin-[acetyl-CoA-carboxylase] ligase
MQIIYYPHESIDSTNTWAKQNCHLFPKEALSVVWTREQAKGRGRYGRTWMAPACKNVTASFVIANNLPPAHLYCVSQCMALCLKELLMQYHVASCIKWPNDLLIGDKKIAGILVESSEAFLIIGVGLNVNMTQAELLHIPKKATSLFVETGKKQDPLRLIEELSLLFATKLTSLEKVPKAWMKEVSWMIGQRRTISTPNRTVEGTIQKIDEDGTITFRTDTQEICRISSGEVYI